MSEAETVTDPAVEVPSHWPPVVHLIDHEVLRPGDRAVCGAILRGILFPSGTPITCEKCREWDRG